jgi:hypothetical protein
MSGVDKKRNRPDRVVANDVERKKNGRRPFVGRDRFISSRRFVQAFAVASRFPSIQGPSGVAGADFGRPPLNGYHNDGEAVNSDFFTTTRLPTTGIIGGPLIDHKIMSSVADPRPRVGAWLRARPAPDGSGSRDARRRPRGRDCDSRQTL